MFDEGNTVSSNLILLVNLQYGNKNDKGQNHNNDNKGQTTSIKDKGRRKGSIKPHPQKNIRD